MESYEDTGLGGGMHRRAAERFGGIWFDGDDAPAYCDEWGLWKSANIRHFLY